MIGMIAMAVFSVAGSMLGSALVAALLLIIGICNCGPDSVLIGAITAEMGGNDGSGAGVTSFVNGFGSIGGILEGPLLGVLVSNAGWGSVLITIVASAIVTIFALIKYSFTYVHYVRVDFHVFSFRAEKSLQSQGSNSSVKYHPLNEA